MATLRFVFYQNKNEKFFNSKKFNQSDSASLQIYFIFKTSEKGSFSFVQLYKIFKCLVFLNRFNSSCFYSSTHL